MSLVYGPDRIELLGKKLIVIRSGRSEQNDHTNKERQHTKERHTVETDGRTSAMHMRTIDTTKPPKKDTAATTKPPTSPSNNDKNKAKHITEQNDLDGHKEKPRFGDKVPLASIHHPLN